MSTRVDGVTGWGSCLLDLAWFLIYTSLGFAQDGLENSEVDFRQYLNSLSWGFAIDDVQNNDLIEWNVTGWTFPNGRVVCYGNGRLPE